ncbi:MAG: hypothetical protein U0132_15015 [Gemmatimonadaceae bacterium]
MSTTREVVAGTTRTCPHCRATILESAVRCPACNHHLRFDPTAASRALPSFSPLRVEGSIVHPPTGDPWEYSLVVAIRNGKGEEITRQVVGVGAINPDDVRTFTLSVEVFTPDPKSALRKESR